MFLEIRELACLFGKQKNHSLRILPISQLTRLTGIVGKNLSSSFFASESTEEKDVKGKVINCPGQVVTKQDGYKAFNARTSNGRLVLSLELSLLRSSLAADWVVSDYTGFEAKAFIGFRSATCDVGFTRIFPLVN
jgi:hypothetical protein